MKVRNTQYIELKKEEEEREEQRKKCDAAVAEISIKFQQCLWFEKSLSNQKLWFIYAIWMWMDNVTWSSFVYIPMELARHSYLAYQLPSCHPSFLSLAHPHPPRHPLLHHLPRPHPHLIVNIKKIKICIDCSIDPSKWAESKTIKTELFCCWVCIWNLAKQI